MFCLLHQEIQESLSGAPDVNLNHEILTCCSPFTKASTNNDLAPCSKIQNKPDGLPAQTDCPANLQELKLISTIVLKAKKKSAQGFKDERWAKQFESQT